MACIATQIHSYICLQGPCSFWFTVFCKAIGRVKSKRRGTEKGWGCHWCSWLTCCIISPLISFPGRFGECSFCVVWPQRSPCTAGWIHQVKNWFELLKCCNHSCSEICCRTVTAFNLWVKAVSLGVKTHAGLNAKSKLGLSWHYVGSSVSVLPHAPQCCELVAKIQNGARLATTIYVWIENDKASMQNQLKLLLFTVTF